MHYKGVGRQRPVFVYLQRCYCKAGRRADTLCHSHVCWAQFLKVSLYIHSSHECKVHMSTGLVRDLHMSLWCAGKNKVTMLRFELLEPFPRSFLLHLEEK